jgi:NYN domain
VTIRHALLAATTRLDGGIVAPLEAVQGERVLHLADVENLVGTASFSCNEAAETYTSYKLVAPHGAIDQLVIATSHHSAVAACFGWQDADARRVRSGENGADLELLAVLEHESVETRFDRVVIGSGDGIFALAAARLQAAAVKVTVVARRNALSRSLRLAVHDIRFIDTPAPANPQAVTVPKVA